MRAGRREHRDRSGTAAVEMAMVLPLFFALLLGTVEFARFGMAVQLLTTAAREGCRKASLPGTDAGQVQTAVDNVLKGSGIPSPTPTFDQPDWAEIRQGQPITLTLSVPYEDISWLSNANPVDMINRLLVPGGGTTPTKTNVKATATFCSEKPWP